VRREEVGIQGIISVVVVIVVVPVQGIVECCDAHHPFDGFVIRGYVFFLCGLVSIRELVAVDFRGLCVG